MPGSWKTGGHAVWGAVAGAALGGLVTGRCVAARLTAGCQGECNLGIIVQVLFGGFGLRCSSNSAV